jgi:two-component system, OmpR family, sensor histidine kinase KdpD
MSDPRRGELRIYVGFAAGVGKTYAMLNEGHRRRDRGTDVVIGFVETHGRQRTADQVGDLEVVTRRSIVHRGSRFEEMDVEAIIARRPEVVLVDELAHTNVPGSRNAKRWQDVEELREAGIDVISTVNIQHLESVNDVIQRITGVAQRETIPDEIVRSADQQELVDMTPHALRRRMAHGNVYPPEKIDAALGNYFREGNLGALRELALLWMADRVDESLHEYMQAHEIEGPWETRERVLVGVTSRPEEDEPLVRRAARMATRRGGDLIALHVVPEDGVADAAALAASRELVRVLGGTFREVVGASVPDALLDVARAENVTQVVLGASGRSRLTELVRGSVINRVIRQSGPIDVHVISGDVPAGKGAPRRGRVLRGLPPRRQLAGFALGAAGLPLLTVALATVRDSLGLPADVLLYLTLVVAVGAVGGIWPALATAVTASFLLNWYFTPPIHTWTIAEAENVLALIVFVAVALVVSVLVDRAERSRAEAARGRAEAEALARLAGSMAAESDPLPTLVRQAATTFGLDGAAVLSPSASGWHVEATAGTPIAAPGEGDETIELEDDAVLVLRGNRLPAEQRRVLVAFGAQLTAAVRARALEREAADAERVSELSDLRAALLSAVSHDLRTPLASIKTAASSLRQDDVVWTDGERQEFLATIEEETDRLADLVANLLDMSRIQSGMLRLVPTLVGLDEVVLRALASLPGRGRDVEVDVPEDLPRIDVDAALLERAVANLVANARAFSPPGASVQVLGSSAGFQVDLRIVDRGPGIPAEHLDRVFEPFQRLGDRTGDGVGLGLAVARGFVEAMGGSLTPEDTPGGGLTMVVSFRSPDRSEGSSARPSGAEVSG